MDKQTISFRIDSEKLTALDAIAEALARDRTHVLNEAIAAYLDVQQWHVDQVKAAIRQADAGNLVDHSQVRTMFRKRRKK